MYRQFCPQGHDTFRFGRASNGQCRVCRRAQQTTPAYRARRRQRQSTPEFLEKRQRYYATIGFPRRMALRVAASISALPTALRGLFAHE